MTNIFLREPVYITTQEIKDTTPKTDLSSLSDDNIKILIAKAEDLIDNYIGSYGTPFISTQTLIFPINDDGISVIPNEIKVATYYVVEQLFENGDTIKGSVTITGSGAISSERVGDHSVTYDVGTTTTSTTGLSSLGLPNEAIQLLNKYRQVFFKRKL